MRRAAKVVWLLGLLAAMPLSAGEAPRRPEAAVLESAVDPFPGVAPSSDAPAPAAGEAAGAEPAPWQTAWGLVGLRGIPAGPKAAPNGQEYHPNFSLDLNFNIWLWRDQGLYLFADLRLWGQKGEGGVTNGRDGFVGTSKRQLDLFGGAAWNYAGPWELRALGFTQNNLNRGDSFVRPTGFTDGFGVENRYYLSPEYDRLGQAGFDVARATFLSVGYLPTKVLVGNDGQTFKPGLMLRAYLTLGPDYWPCYAFADTTYIGEAPFNARLLVFDLGAAARPFRSWRQWEFRLGAENTADFHARDVWSLWYASVRFLY
jgi:hypothetical protein